MSFPYFYKKRVKKITLIITTVSETHKCDNVGLMPSAVISEEMNAWSTFFVLYEVVHTGKSPQKLRQEGWYHEWEATNRLAS